MDWIIFQCTLSILMWIFVILMIRRNNNDNLHPLIILLLFYILNYPIKMIASRCGIFLINSNAIGANKQALAILLSDISMFIIVFVFLRKPRIKENLSIRLWSGDYDFWNATIFFVVLFVISGRIAYGGGSVSRMFSLEAMMDFRSYRSAELIGGGASGFFGSIMTIALYSFVYLGVCTTYKKPLRKKVLFFIAVIILTWYGYAQTLAKTTLLMTPLVLIISYHQCIRRSKGGKGISLKWIGIVGILGLISVAVMELTDVMAVRVVKEAKSRALLDSFFNPSFDAPDNLTAILDRIDNFPTGDLQFRPFLYNLFMSKIPRGLWPGKSPINGKIMIVKQLMPEFFVSNTNYNSASPSIVGDALASGGIVFVFILSIIYGILFYNIYRAARASNNLNANLLYIYLILNFNNFCRGGSDILGNLLYYYILVCIVCGVYKGFNKIRVRFGKRRYFDG